MFSDDASGEAVISPVVAPYDPVDGGVPVPHRPVVEVVEDLGPVPGGHVVPAPVARPGKVLPWPAPIVCPPIGCPPIGCPPIGCLDGDARCRQPSGRLVVGEPFGHSIPAAIGAAAGEAAEVGPPVPGRPAGADFETGHGVTQPR